MQRVEEQLSKKLPFVLYRKPNQNNILGIFQHTPKLHVLANRSTETGFIFAPFDDSKISILIPVDEQLSADDFKYHEQLGSGKVSISIEAKKAHNKIVENAIDQIKKDKLQKVVVSRKIVRSNTHSATELYQRLLSMYSAAFCYLWYHPKVGLWLGASPEMLLQTNNKQFTTMSLASTQPYVENKIPEWGAKEFKEQELVTGYIQEVLKNKVSSLNKLELETIKAGNLLHLRTKLTGRFTSDLNELIEALHPTPAVCGIPKDAAKDFIQNNENYDREYYTGYLGELNFKLQRQRNDRRRNQENQAYKSIKTTSDLYVNLRCMKLENELSTIYVGGGITADSIPEKEWEETVNKSATMLRVLS